MFFLLFVGCPKGFQIMAEKTVRVVIFVDSKKKLKPLLKKRRTFTVEEVKGKYV